MFLKKSAWQIVIFLLCILVTASFLVNGQVTILFRIEEIYLIICVFAWAIAWLVKILYRAHQEGEHFGWRQILILVVTILVIISPIFGIIGKFWSIDVTQHTGLLIFDLTVMIIGPVCFVVILFFEIILTMLLIHFIWDSTNLSVQDRQNRISVDEFSEVQPPEEDL